MCTLYKIKPSRAEIAGLFSARLPPDLPETAQELYPKRLAPVIRRDAGGLLLDAMRWGFPPPASARAPVVNIRNLASPFWRTALAKADRRCLVPASEFCEYEGPPGAKAKRWFRCTDQPVFAFAGLWRPTPDGAVFAFLTCEPNPLVVPIHPKAMPVILESQDHLRWLDGDSATAAALAQPYPSQLMAVD